MFVSSRLPRHTGCSRTGYREATPTPTAGSARRRCTSPGPVAEGTSTLVGILRVSARCALGTGHGTRVSVNAAGYLSWLPGSMFPVGGAQEPPHEIAAFELAPLPAQVVRGLY